MGYYIKCIESRFELKPESKKQALENLKNFVNLNQEDLGWTNNYEVLKSNTIEEALENCRWKILDNSTLEFLGERLEKDKEIFDILAPYVKETSYITILGENGYVWIWNFENNKCNEIDYPY